jgi:hypothetical protein
MHGQTKIKFRNEISAVPIRDTGSIDCPYKYNFYLSFLKLLNLSCYLNRRVFLQNIIFFTLFQYYLAATVIRVFILHIKMPPAQCVNSLKIFFFFKSVAFITQTKQDRQCTCIITFVSWRSVYASSAIVRAWYYTRPFEMAQTTWPLKMGTIGCPETSVRDCHSTQCKIPT